MRKIGITLNDIKDKIDELIGKEIKMQVNRGRRRIENYEAIVEKTYPSVFTVRVMSESVVDTMSYSYSEVLCGDVKITIKKSA
jgi:uncharacterized protein Veg